MSTLAGSEGRRESREDLVLSVEVRHVCKFDRMVLLQFDIQLPSQACVPFKAPRLTLPAISPTSVLSLLHLYTNTLLSVYFPFLYMYFSKSLPLILSPSEPCPPQPLLYTIPWTLPWEYLVVSIPKFSLQPSRAGFTPILSQLYVHSHPTCLSFGANVPVARALAIIAKCSVKRTIGKWCLARR